MLNYKLPWKYILQLKETLKDGFSNAPNDEILVWQEDLGKSLFSVP